MNWGDIMATLNGGITESGGRKLPNISSIPVRNFTKIRVLLYLKRMYDCYLGGRSFGEYVAWVSIPELATGTESSAATLRVIMPRWASHNWYVYSHTFRPEVMSDRRQHTFYRIGPKGLSYLERLHKWYEYESRVRDLVDILEDGTNELQVRYIVWPAFPGARQAGEAVGLTWPFETDKDATVWRGASYIKVDNPDQAVSVAEKLFDTQVSDRCLDQAIEIQKHIAKEHGYSVRVRG